MTAVKAPRATEAQCERTIIAAARTLGYRVHAVASAQTPRGTRGWGTPLKGDPGFPDLVICGHGILLIVELKRRPNRVEPAQQAWLDELGNVGNIAAVCWVPEGMDAFIARLQELAA